MTKEQISGYTLKITNANSTGLVVILYDIFDAYIDDAKEALKKPWSKESPDEYVKALRMASQVIRHLEDALNFSYEISGSLYPLYDFVERTLAKATYTRNIKDIANKIVGVELSDVSEMISYDIELGKDIEKSFDLEERIIEHSELFENIEDLYVMDGDDRVIASTGDSDVILPRDLTFLGEGYLIENGLLYSINSLSDDVSIVATTKADFMDELDGDYIYNLIISQ